MYKTGQNYVLMDIILEGFSCKEVPNDQPKDKKHSYVSVAGAFRRFISKKSYIRLKIGHIHLLHSHSIPHFTSRPNRFANLQAPDP